MSGRRPGSGRALLAASLVIALVGCSRDRNTGEAGVSGSAVVDREAPGTDGSPGDSLGSLFDLPFALTDQDGRARHLSDLRGRPFVASMIYRRCTSVCPRITEDLRNLERALPSRDRARVRFVLFSLDPEHDTPEALRAFAAEHSLDPGRWTLLATHADDLRTLAAVLGVRYRPDEGGQIAHSALIAVVDGEGVIRHRQLGTGNDPGPLRSAVHAVR
jgi:protein SCO1/2